ncbi:14131_t:CDS:2, partial [Racocetra persica]
MCRRIYSLLPWSEITLISPGNYTAQSIYYRSIPQVIFENEYFGFDNKSSELNKALLDDNYERLLVEYRKVSVKSYVPFYNIYKKVAEEINADLFFCDYFINYPCFDLAWKLGKPAVGTSSVGLSRPPYVSDPTYGCVNMENESFYNRFRCEILVPLRLAWSTSSTVKGLNVQRAIVGVEPHGNKFGQIGPVLPDTFPGLTPDLDSFLDSHPRTLYFALGTI